MSLFIVGVLVILVICFFVYILRKKKNGANEKRELVSLKTNSIIKMSPEIEYGDVIKMPIMETILLKRV